MRKSKAERTLDQTLAQIEKGQGYLVDVRRQLHAARQGHVPARPLSDRATAHEIAAWDERAERIAHLEGEEARLVENLRLAWDVAAGLAEPPGRLPGTDAEVEAQMRALEARRSELTARAGSFREDRHDAVDVMLGYQRERLDAILASSPIGAAEVEDVIRLWPVTDPKLAEALHAAVDAEATLTDGRSNWQDELDLLARQIARRRAELELRAQERAAEEAERERKAAEVRLAAVGAGDEEVGS